MAKMFRLKGYHKLITCNRDWGKRGGVGFYIDDKLKFRVLLKDTTREWLMVEVFSPFKAILAVTYRCEKRYS